MQRTKTSLGCERSSARPSRPAPSASAPVRSDNHRSADGDPTPASEAAGRELSGIAEAFAGLNHGVLQAVNDFDIMQGDARFHPEFDLLEDMMVASGGRPMSISTMQRDHSARQ